MIEKLIIDNDAIALEVLTLQKSSYAIEAEIIKSINIPLLKETIENLLKCDEEFYGYFIDKKLVGLVSYKVVGEVLDIHRLAVHPQYFKRGIAKELIEYVDNTVTDVKKEIVSTGKDNYPAIKLYEKSGFKPVTDRIAAKGIVITELEKFR